jgi:hypothetical protein
VTDADPTLDVVAAHRSRKAERDAPLLAKLLGTDTEAGTNPAREPVEKALEELDAAVAALEGEQEPEPERGFLDAVRADQAVRKRALVDAITGRNETPAGATTGLDGGARQTPERPETHEQTLIAVLRSGHANVGANL